MREKLTDRVRAAHVLDAIAEIGEYLKGVTYEEFVVDSEKRFATLKQLEIIGEACNNITSEIRENYPDVEWKLMRGFRNISIHEYFDVSLSLVWQIAQNDIPVLKQQFEILIKDLQ
jgi:uncharacterized protein with HEPN domain